MSAVVIGVDPGFSGAVAVLFPEGGIVPSAYVHDMPTVAGAKGKTELNHAELYNKLGARSSSGPTIMWIEKVGARPGQGVSSMFRFGQQVGALEMAAAAHRYELRYVTPATWKAYFGLSADKGTARGYAIKRFPALADQLSRVKDDGRAEALLIALYGREHSK